MRRSALESSTVTTCTSVEAADNRGRANAKQSTKNQYAGLSAAAAVANSPTSSVRRSTRVRPQRSANDDSGSAPSDDKRKIARASPSTEPDSPTWLCSDRPPEWWPKCFATSLSDATAPNWAKPATSATRKRIPVTRSRVEPVLSSGARSAKLHAVVHDDEGLAVISPGKEEVEGVGRVFEAHHEMFDVRERAVEHHCGQF
jgi:hypothetical protein